MTRARRHATTAVAAAALLLVAAAAVPVLREEWYILRLESADPEIQAAAAQRLGELGATRAVPALIGAAVGGAAGTREAVTRALREFGPAAVPGLAAVLRDGDVPECLVAVEHLGALGPRAERALPALLRLLDDPRDIVRADAIWAIAAIARPESDVGGPIARNLDHPNWRVRSRARWALAFLGAEREPE